MKKHLIQSVIMFALIGTIDSQFATGAPQNTAFTYQGRLHDNSAPATGVYDLRFVIFDTEAGGNQVGDPVTNSAVNVSNGLFTATLDFGSEVFDGLPRWIEVAVRTNGATSFVTLNPLQLLAPSPYAISAKTLSGEITADQVIGTIANNQLANSSITLNAGTGLSGGGTITLGGSATLNNGGVLSVTGNPDITANTTSGHVVLGSTGTSANTANTIVKRDANGNFTAGTVTVSTNLNLPSTTANAGAIYSAGSRILHSYGGFNFFAGGNAGNFTMTGAGNTATGVDALRNNTSGNFNTAHGWQAALNNTSGCWNTAIGSSAFSSNQTGERNTAVGYQALTSNTNGLQNTAVGYNALLSNTNGADNTAVGVRALQANRSGTGNTAVGNGALTSNSAGNQNTAVGAGALTSVVGTNNTAIGYGSGAGLTTGSNNICIGNSGAGSESNTIRIGAFQSATYIAGIRFQSVPGGLAVYVDDNGRLGTTTSSARFKEDIESMDGASSDLLSLRPVTFRYKSKIDPKGIPHFGLVAEEVARVNPGLVVRDDNNEIFTVRYDAVNAMLLNEFLKQHRKVEDQASEIQELKESVVELRKIFLEKTKTDTRRIHSNRRSTGRR